MDAQKPNGGEFCDAPNGAEAREHGPWQRGTEVVRGPSGTDRAAWPMAPGEF